MFLCMYVCMHVCMYVCMYVSFYVLGYVTPIRLRLLYTALESDPPMKWPVQTVL